MKFNHTTFNIFLSGIMMGVISMGLLITFPIQEKQEIRNYISENEKEIIDNCFNLSIVDTSECLVDSINPFYFYNLTDDKEELTIDDLKQRGGDCKDWSELYAKLGRELGFYSRNFVIRTREEVSHQIAVLSNKYAYCLIDSSREKSFSRCIELEGE